MKKRFQFLQIIKAFCNNSIEERYDSHLTTGELDNVWSTVVSIFLIGGVTGSLIASLLADKFGRRGALAAGNFCGIVGAVMFLLVPTLDSVELLMAGRLMVGKLINNKNLMQFFLYKKDI